jgi:hypothetical protein
VVFSTLAGRGVIIVIFLAARSAMCTEAFPVTVNCGRMTRRSEVNLWLETVRESPIAQ